MLVLTAEAIAIRNDTKATIQVDFNHTHIEWDDKIVIQAVEGYIQSLREIQVLVQDIHT